MHVYIDAPGVLGVLVVLYMYICMHYLARYLARLSLFGGPICALGGMDVSQVECVCIMNVCIYRRAGVLGVLYMYVCMHVGMYYVCMYFCTLFGALFGTPIGAPGGIDVSQMGYAYLGRQGPLQHTGRLGQQGNNQMGTASQQQKADQLDQPVSEPHALKIRNR